VDVVLSGESQSVNPIVQEWAERSGKEYLAFQPNYTKYPNSPGYAIIASSRAMVKSADRVLFPGRRRQVSKNRKHCPLCYQARRTGGQSSFARVRSFGFPRGADSKNITFTSIEN
jgi:hypothetical protein